MKDMGKVMAALKERFAGQMDFAKASAVVKERCRPRNKYLSFPAELRDSVMWVSTGARRCRPQGRR